MHKIHFLILMFFLACESALLAQNRVGLKLFGLSIHPQGEKANAFLMPNKLDKEGYLVLNIGAMASYEHMLFRDVLSVKVVQALYSDCAARLGGFSHIGLRGKIFKSGNHALYGGIGPTLVFRRNWLEMEGYENQNRFHGNENARWQYLFLWYGGELEYSYRLNENFFSAITFVPGYPDLMSLSVGIIYQLRKPEGKSRNFKTLSLE